jgi:uncharacterized protein
MNNAAIYRPLTSPPRPWYREPWPWILMSGPALVVVAGIVTTVIAVRFADPLVIDQYYKEGLAINRVLERDRAALARGYRATVLFNRDLGLARVHLTGETLPGELRLRFVHPTKSGLDREFAAERIAPGLYQAPVLLALATRWRVELEDAQRQWRLTGVWTAAQDNFVLVPRE